MMKAALAVMILVCVSAAAYAHLRPAGERKDSWRKVSETVSVKEYAPGVWAHRSMGEFAGEPVPANGMVVVSRGQAVLIDTAWTNPQAEQLLHWIEGDLHARITAAIITHFHDDRAGGMNRLVRRKIPVVANERTFALLKSNVPLGLRRSFDHSYRQHVGDVKLRAFYPGAGHTKDNIVVAIEPAHILFGGCLIKSAENSSMGNIADADVAAWKPSVENVQRWFPNPKWILPGHGEVGGSELYQHTEAIVGRR